MITRLNAGTIPDRGNYAVHLGAEGPRIGELDEEMVFETRAGECILLGASSWRVEEITRDRVIVSPAPGEPGKLPFWRGDGPGRPLELGRAVGAFCRKVPPERRRGGDWIMRGRRRWTPRRRQPGRLHPRPARGHRPGTERPHHRHRALSRRAGRLAHLHPDPLRRAHPRPLGHGPAMAAGRREGFEIQVMYTDDGIVLRLADGEDLPDLMTCCRPGRHRGPRHRAARRHRAVRQPVPRERRPRAAAAAPLRQGPPAALGAAAQGAEPARRGAPLSGLPGGAGDLPPGAQRPVFDLAGLKDLLRAIRRPRRSACTRSRRRAPRPSPARWCSPMSPPTSTSRTPPSPSAAPRP
jgi:ATP-dependent Lhr-like helicase